MGECYVSGCNCGGEYHDVNQKIAGLEAERLRLGGLANERAILKDERDEARERLAHAKRLLREARPFYAHASGCRGDVACRCDLCRIAVETDAFLAGEAAPAQEQSSDAEIEAWRVRATRYLRQAWTHINGGHTVPTTDGIPSEGRRMIEAAVALMLRLRPAQEQSVNFSAEKWVEQDKRGIRYEKSAQEQEKTEGQR